MYTTEIRLHTYLFWAAAAPPPVAEPLWLGFGRLWLPPVCGWPNFVISKSQGPPIGFAIFFVAPFHSLFFFFFLFPAPEEQLSLASSRWSAARRGGRDRDHAGSTFVHLTPRPASPTNTAGADDCLRRSAREFTQVGGLLILLGSRGRCFVASSLPSTVGCRLSAVHDRVEPAPSRLVSWRPRVNNFYD